MNMFPHTVTLYNTEVTVDKATLKDTETQHITILHGVMLTANKARNVVESGLTTADAVTLYVPFDVEAVDGVTGEAKTYTGPVEFWNAEDKNGIWTLSTGGNCFFVKGEAVEDTDTPVQTIEAKYDYVYDVTTVDYMDYGDDMAHWEVGGN